MKHKKLILFMALLIITTIYIVHPYMNYKEAYVNSCKDDIIRFHIKANSDEEKDQELKLKIRDEILERVGNQFENTTSPDETRKLIKDNLYNIKRIAEEVIQREGKDYPVQVSLGRKNFPTRKYGDITFPSGEYETLQVTIGEGKGKNWWWVMFPPLCFVDITHGNAIHAEEDLKELLTEEEVDLLLSSKEPPIIIKSKILEVLERTKTYLARRLAQR